MFSCFLFFPHETPLEGIPSVSNEYDSSKMSSIAHGSYFRKMMSFLKEMRNNQRKDESVGWLDGTREG